MADQDVQGGRVEWTAPLRCCGGCTGFFLGDDSPAPYLCPRCRARRRRGFNPQRGDVVCHVDRQTGPYSALVVVGRRGDLVDVRPLGFPDDPVVTFRVGALLPA